MSSKSPEMMKLLLKEQLLNESLDWWEKETLKAVKESEELEKSSIYKDVSEEEEEVSQRMSYLMLKGDFERKQLDSLELEYNDLHTKELSSKLKLSKITKKKL